MANEVKKEEVVTNIGGIELTDAKPKKQTTKKNTTKKTEAKVEIKEENTEVKSKEAKLVDGKIKIVKEEVKTEAKVEDKKEEVKPIEKKSRKRKSVFCIKNGKTYEGYSSKEKLLEIGKDLGLQYPGVKNEENRIVDTIYWTIVYCINGKDSKMNQAKRERAEACLKMLESDETLFTIA